MKEDVAPGEVAADLWRHPDAPAPPVPDTEQSSRKKNLAAGIAKKSPKASRRLASRWRRWSACSIDAEKRRKSST
eukprot:jgi/Tetstr1/456928/TSEL_043598.t1